MIEKTNKMQQMFIFNNISTYLIPTLTKAHNVQQDTGESKKETDTQIQERAVRNKTVEYWGDLQQTVIKWQSQWNKGGRCTKMKKGGGREGGTKNENETRTNHTGNKIQNHNVTQDPNIIKMHVEPNIQSFE